MKNLVSNFNWPLFGVVMGLIVIGLVNLYSAVYFWGEGGSSNLFWSQLVWIIIGLIAMMVVSFLDYRLFNRLAYPLYGISIVLLVLALVLGDAVRGTHGWLKLGPISLQPAEFAKISYILAMARYFGNYPNPDGYGFVELLKPLGLMLLPCGLIMLQGDLGSSMFLILIFSSVAIFAKVRTKTLVTMVVVALIAGFAVYSFGLKDYQRARITTFVHPESDVRGSGYHLMQSKIAVGSGGLAGKGYLKGNINKLRYLPERHTDFVFPVLAEEWGFAGSMVLLILYAGLLLMGIEIARKSKERFANFLAVGITMMLFWQLLINLGGVLGLMPLTGVTLPLLSYGGSSMVAVLVSLGILLNISRRRFIF
jgi:rod shape determining protein RodA